MRFSRSKKFISMLIIFVIVFTYTGQTLEAIASTDGIASITDGFFANSNIKLSSYFEEAENQSDEKVSDVNEKATLLLEVSPEKIGKGFIREGKITANSVDGADLNFKFSTIKDVIEVEELEDEDNDKTDEEENETKNEVENKMQNENTTVENTVEQETGNKASEKNVEYIDITSRSSEPREEEKQDEENREEDEQETEEKSDENKEDELVDEEKIIQEMLNTEEDEKTWGKHQVQLLSDNEIEVKNVVNKIRIEVEIEYLPKEEINPANLYKKVAIDLNAKYIDVNLKETEESVHNEIAIGWRYHKDIEIASEYTKFSPYQVGERQGSILENKVTLKRETEDENYLPLKSTSLEITVPMLEGEKPSSVSIVANKLMASKGQDTGVVEFTENDWNYNQDDEKITIHTNNDKDGLAVNTLGVDEYVIVYKYDRFVEEGNYTFDKKVVATAEEYSGNENGTLEQTLEESQEIQAVIGDMISYSISTSGDAVGKGKINANYNQETALYETEFTTTVNLNILTSDVFEEITVDSTKENYVDAAETAFETNDIYYKKVKFNNNEIRNILESGGAIEIYNNNRELLHTLNAETIESQENCEINLESHPNGILVVLKNVSIDQNLSMEYTKAIGKSNYDKASFNTFREIESKVTATVKYPDDENEYHLSEISVRKAMESSKTVTSLVLNNDILSTTSKNENVQMKLEFNNDTEDSDLYVNPSFELVFPEYVKDVSIQDISLTYAEGLSVANYQTFLEDGVVKMRIDLSGVQTQFSESTLTRGTNLLITADITVDEYAPSKKDQIKMYYYNEGVTNYRTQTKWSVAKDVPAGMVRDTNGFEAVVIHYAAPSGFVTSTAISNYDGQGSTVASIRQGEKVVRVEKDAPAKIATMHLYVANNKEETCNDVVLMGRIPFENNADVMTNEDLGTNVNTRMVSNIREEANSNENSIIIYYSSNETATPDLADTDNGWTEQPETLDTVKSYMIVVEGEWAAQSVLKFNYDFEIPANLEEGTLIYGSFGAYFNDETSVADKVGLQTEVSIPIKINLASDIAENVGVGEGRFINYTLTVTNVGSDILNEIELTNNVPEGTTLYNKIQDDLSSDSSLVATNARTLDWMIEELAPQGVYTQEYMVKVNPGMANNVIGNIAFAKMGDCEKKSNRVEVNVFASSFWIDIENSAQDSLLVGHSLDYTVKVKNLTRNTEKKVKMRYKVPKELEVTSISDGKKELKYSTDGDEVIYTIPEIAFNETKTFYISQKAIKENKKGVASQINFELEDGTVEKSSEVNFKIMPPQLQVYQSMSGSNDTIKPGEDINIEIGIVNDGEFGVAVNIKNELSEYLEPKRISVSEGDSSYTTAFEEHNIDESVLVYNGETTQLQISATVKEDAAGKKIRNKWTISGDNMDDIVTEEQTVTVSKEKKNKKSDKQETAESNIITTNDISDGDYKIAGKIWVDINGNGAKEDEDTQGVPAKVQLMSNGSIVESMRTNGNGEYSFSNLKPGDYMVVATYDENMYGTTRYTSNIANNNSNMFEAQKGNAITDMITITDSDVENVDVGLIEKERFDFSIQQSVTKATVVVNGKEYEYQYDDLDLAKLALTSSQLKDANVKFEYKIRVSNVGNVAGKVSSIVNYLPKDMTFNKEENPFWALNDNGEIYYFGLKDTIIAVDDYQDVTLILEKKLTGEDVIINNQSGIAQTEGQVKVVEAKSNNFTAQQTVVAKCSVISTPIIITEIVLIALVTIFGYMIKTEKIDISILVKKVYK